MKETFRILPVYTGDVSGVCSALYELGGMVVIHDPSGCNSTYNTHDEIRWYDRDSLIFLSGLCDRDALFGRDDKLIEDTVEAAMLYRPAFIALCNSPIPWLSGMDFAAVCRKIEERTKIPCFYVATNAMHDYTVGAGDALAAYAKKMLPIYRTACPNASGKRLRINILGMTPLDSGDALAHQQIMQAFAGEDVDILSIWAQGCETEKLTEAWQADVNLVVSAVGLPVAEFLRSAYGIPYVSGLPLAGTRDVLGSMLRASAGDGKCRKLGGENSLRGDARGSSRNRTLILGEPVTCLSLAESLYQKTEEDIRVISTVERGRELLLPDLDENVWGEEQTEALLGRHAEEMRETGGTLRVIADPLFRLICPPETVFTGFPHLAMSGRVYLPELRSPFEEEALL